MNRRDRTRQETIASIRRAALEQIVNEGAGGISLNEIARQLGMTGPALFRYVRNRNDLITDLVVDAYTELGDALWRSVEETAGQPVPKRLRAHAAAYRSWAIDNPHRYALLFGSPVPGYQAPTDMTQPAAIRAMASTFALASAWAEPGVRPATGIADDPLSVALREWARKNDLPALSGGWLRQAILGWTRLHGVLSLELEGHFRFGLPDPAVIYDSEVEELIRLIMMVDTGASTS